MRSEPNAASAAARAVALLLLCAALAAADECPAKDKSASDELTKAGRMLLKNSQASAAKACFLKAVGQSPKYVPALLELGTLESKDKEYDAAVKHLSAALQARRPRQRERGGLLS